MGSKGASAMAMTQDFGERPNLQNNSITPRQYLKLREIFLKVLDLPISEQAIALDRVCKGDSELRSQVHELLAIDRVLEGSHI